MIDEKKLIEELEDIIGMLPTYYIGKKDEENAYLDAINRILSAVKRQPKVGEWIPVEKELPKEDGEYLVYYSCENDGSVGEDKECGYSVEYFDTEMESFGYWQNIFDSGTLGFVDSEFIEMNTAIAWMPLPNPYGGNIK